MSAKHGDVLEHKARAYDSVGQWGPGNVLPPLIACEIDQVHSAIGLHKVTACVTAA